MQKAMEETERRRNKQLAFNLEHNITPKSAVRKITDKIDTGEAEEEVILKTVPSAISDVDESILHNPKLLVKEINRLDKQMRQFSQALKFEEAAKVRDKLVALKGLLLQ